MKKPLARKLARSAPPYTNRFWEEPWEGAAVLTGNPPEVLSPQEDNYGPFRSEQLPYLEFHREIVFKQ